MADDADRTLARLAVDAGFLTKDEAMRYWQQCQAPGAPRFIQLLVQSGRLSPADLNQLRALWQRASSGASAALGPSGPPSAAVAVAPPPASLAMSTRPGANLKSTDDGSWEEALEKDTQLARTLFARGLVTQDRLRECRALQLQHRLRLGVVLLKKGYLDQASIDDAVRATGVGGPTPPTGPGQTPSGALPRPALGASGRVQRPAQPTNPFMATPSAEPIDQDAMPTLNVPPGSFPPGSPMMTPGPRHGPQDAIPTILGGQSVEELNPFAMGAPAPPPAMASGRTPAREAVPAPAPGQLSRDELNAFDDIPLGPPPSPAAAPQPYLPAGSAAEGDITMPPGYTPEGAAAPPPAEESKDPKGSSQPEANLPDSGGEKPAAPKKKKTTMRQAPPAAKGGGGGRLVIMLVVGAVLIAVAAVAAWQLGVFG